MRQTRSTHTMTHPTPLPQDRLLPRPRRLKRVPGHLSLRDIWRICTASDADPLLDGAARLLGEMIGHRRSRSVDSGSHTIVTLERADRGRGDQWYTLRIRPDGIRLRATGELGFRYGVLTLVQLVEAGCTTLQAMDIEDWPDFVVRGVMLDISRDKVPTIATLEGLIDLLAGWKINQLQLYTEHTFAYRGHEAVWRGASAMTGAQIRRLDEYCRRRGIELVPNQNSLSHMERWLCHQRYAPLAECAGPWKTPWGEVRHRSTALSPVNPGSIRLVSSLYDQLLPHFSSGLFNVGCDEPWELGQGRSREACRKRGADRVYLDYLLKVRRAAARHGRRILFWGDWLQKYPDLIERLPDDVIPLVWGYEADHPFDRSCAQLRAKGLTFYVCPGTSSWCSFGGRTNNALTNLRLAAQSGKRHRAAGYLITDWGDFGHRQYLPVSYAGFLYGAALSWCITTNSDLDIARALDRHVFFGSTAGAGRLWLEAGRVHDISGVALNNRTVLFACMQTPLGDVSGVEGLRPGVAEQMADRAAELAASARRMRFGGPQASLIKDELVATLLVLRHACRRAQFIVAQRTGRRAGVGPRWLAADMTRIIERHRALWQARNRRGGLASSVANYQRNLKEYQSLLG